MSNYQIPMKGEEITSRLQSIGTKSDTAAEDTAFGRIAKNTETIKTLARRQYDYLKINGLTTNSTSEQVKAALTPIGGTEVVLPTNGDTITNGTSISIEVLSATSNTFSYTYNNQLVTLGFSLAEGREAVTSKVQTSLLKQMYDFAKINALTDDSDNEDIEAAIRQLQTSTVSAPSAGALLVDATSLAPLAVVTDSSSDASAHIETFSYTHGGVKYTVTISGEQGALTAKVTTEGGTKRTALTPLFESAGAVFNDETGYYELNTLTDITEEEMIAIYNAPRLTLEGTNETLFSRSMIRTNLCGDYWGNNHVYLNDTFYYNQELEVAYIKDNNYSGSTVYLVESNTGAFYQCMHLRSILTNGYININGLDVTKAFNKCYALEDVKLSMANKSFSLQDCSVLSTDSVRTIIEKESAPKEGITVTLHPDVYDRVIADEGVQAALQAHPLVSLARYEEAEQTE